MQKKKNNNKNTIVTLFGATGRGMSYSALYNFSREFLPMKRDKDGSLLIPAAFTKDEFVKSITELQNDKRKLTVFWDEVEK